jgi:Tat protein secretion system quality control protein TatD with DNase activity
MDFLLISIQKVISSSYHSLPFANMIFDTHSHCYWDTLEPHIDEIISNMEKMGVTKAVQIGCDIESSKKAIVLARRVP